MDFLVFSDDWGRHPSSCEHIFRRLTDEHLVTWVNTIGYRSPSLTWHDVKRATEKLGSWIRGERTVDMDSLISNPTVISPVILPYNRFQCVRSFNRWSVRRSIEICHSGSEQNDSVVLSSLPNVADFYRDHPDQLKIYYCVDDFSVMPGVDTDLIRHMEDELIATSDVILYTARYLARKFEGFEKPTYYLPHGVDFGHFSQEPQVENEPGIDLSDSPVLGFFGLLSDWVDLDMLIQVAHQRPDWTIQLIGNSDTDTSRLDQVPNIRWSKSVPYSLLPTWAQDFDVGLIPFKINALTRAVNPLKFMEYMALGLPVVSSRLPELEQYDQYIYLADNVEQFGDMIELALSENCPEKVEARRHLARENSWGRRAETLLEIINRHQAGKLD